MSAHGQSAFALWFRAASRRPPVVSQADQDVATRRAVPTPLNVMVRGDEVIIYLPSGAALTLSAEDAELSGRRLLDAADVARCKIPKAEP